SSRRRHTRFSRDWSSDVCSSDLNGRRKIIAFKGAFHGRTSLAVSATVNRKIVAPVNETDNVVFLPFNDVDALEQAFDEYGKEVRSEESRVGKGWEGGGAVGGDTE